MNLWLTLFLFAFENFKLACSQKNDLRSFIVCLVQLQDVKENDVQFELVCGISAQGTQPSRVHRVCYQIQVILQIEALEMIAEGSPGRNFNLFCRQSTSKWYFDYFTTNFIPNGPLREANIQHFFRFPKSCETLILIFSHQPVILFFLDEIDSQKMILKHDSIIFRFLARVFLCHYKFVFLEVQSRSYIERLVFSVFETRLPMERSELF